MKPRARLPAPAAVAFDLDGTLVDTVPTRIQAWRKALAEAGIRRSRAEVAPLIGSGGTSVARRSAEAVGRTLDDRAAAAIDRRQGEIFDSLNKRPQPLPGARELLLALTSARVPWAVATSSRPGQVRASVEALRLPQPPIVIDARDVLRAKPAPDLLLKAARRLDVAPERCGYVGDSTWDMQAARAAHMAAVGVLAGSAVGADELRAAGASVVCKDLIELKGLLVRP